MSGGSKIAKRFRKIREEQNSQYERLTKNKNINENSEIAEGSSTSGNLKLVRAKNDYEIELEEMKRNNI